MKATLQEVLNSSSTAVASDRKVRSVISVLALVLAIGCGEEDPPAPSNTDDDDSTEQDDDSTGKTDEDEGEDEGKGDKGEDDGPKKPLDASVKPPKPTSDSGTPAPADSGTTPPAVVDAGKSDASTGPAKDAGPTKDSGTPAATGVCDETTPHGCYVFQPEKSHPGCPAQSPEQPRWYPPLDQWNGCGDVMSKQDFAADPEAACFYKGPKGETANCRCDSNAHWICSCSEDLYSGLFQWPDCMP